MEFRHKEDKIEGRRFEQQDGEGACTEEKRERA